MNRNNYKKNNVNNAKVNDNNDNNFNNNSYNNVKLTLIIINSCNKTLMAAKQGVQGLASVCFLCINRLWWTYKT